MRSISFKITLLYIFLTFLNVFVFCFIIFENKMNYIAQIAKYRAREQALLTDNKITGIFEKAVLNEQGFPGAANIYAMFRDEFKYTSSDFIIFRDDGTLLYENTKEIKLNDFHIREALFAGAERNFEGKSYYFKIDEKNYDMYLYYSLDQFNYNGMNDEFRDSFALFKIRIDYINRVLSGLYGFAFIISAFIILIHAVFIIFLHHIFINPVKGLLKSTKKIIAGDYTVRADIKRNDEIGSLADSFNLMKGTIGQKILELNDRNDKMIKDLKVASLVQKAIYPEINETQLFYVSVYHEPRDLVSGDYHDIIRINEHSFGVIIADVSGHGVQAALITMRIKEAFYKTGKKYEDPGGLLKALNNELSDLLIKYNSCFTAFYLIIQPGKILYSSAAHCQGLLADGKTGGIIELQTKGAIIGVESDQNAAFEVRTETVKKDDIVVLVTDGIIESMDINNAKFDYQGLHEAVFGCFKQSAKTVLDNIVLAERNFSGMNNKKDDKTVIVLRIR